MISRIRIIDAVLRHPNVRRLAGHELRGTLVQLLGPGTTDPSWTVTVPLLAEAIDAALARAEREEARGGRVPEAVVPVLAARLLRELPGLGEAEARRIAQGLAADLRGDGYHVTVPVTARRRRGGGDRTTTPHNPTTS